MITEEPDLNSREGRLAAFRMFLPVNIPLEPRPVREHPVAEQDAHYWQTQSTVERQAREDNDALPPPSWESARCEPVQAYLGLPWATYIDKQVVPEDILRLFRTRMQGYQALAAEWGLLWSKDVRIHTVCQHVDWSTMLPLWEELGITDSHLCHFRPMTDEIAASHNSGVQLWTLESSRGRMGLDELQNKRK